MSRRYRDPTRFLLFGIGFLLVVAAAQVGWWIIDQAKSTAETRDRMAAAYQREVAAAQELRALGVSPNDILRAFPHVAFGPDGAPATDPEALAELERGRRGKLNQYRWEGAFFLLVLVAAGTMLGRTLRFDWTLRRRQRNFLAAVSHEFKSPLASLQLTVETIQMRQPGEAERARLLDRMALDVRRLQAMVSNLLEASRLERGAVTLVPDVVGLQEAIADCVSHLQLPADGSVTIAVEVSPDSAVRVDRVALQSVLDNLLDNALKATLAVGGGEIRVSARRDGGQLALEIVDSGIGFTLEDGRHLFEPFFRPGDEMRRQMRGTGLGLYIVHHLVELAGGRVRAHSDGPNRGARFTVWLPYVRNGE